MTAALAVVKRGVRVQCCQRPSCVGTPLHVIISLSCWINSGDIFSRICLVVGDDGDFLRYAQMKCVESSFRSFGSSGSVCI